jgi:hypothetical protein
VKKICFCNIDADFFTFSKTDTLPASEPNKSPLPRLFLRWGPFLKTEPIEASRDITEREWFEKPDRELLVLRMQQWCSQITFLANPAVIRKPSPAQALLEQLSAQLESVVRTVNKLSRSNLYIANLDTKYIKQILRKIFEHLNPEATTQKSASSSQNSERTHAPTKNAEATSTTKPVPPRRSVFGQLTVTLANTVQRILAPDRAAATISSLRNFLGFSEKVAQNTTPWHRVVIQNISLRDVQEGPK